MAEYEETDESEDNKDFHAEILEKFKHAEDTFSETMQRYENDVRFARKGEQWEHDDVQTRKEQGRPALTVNRMPSFIRQVVNDARQNKPQIKVHPVDNFADPETAEVLNGVIRNIESVSKADLAYDTAIDCAATGGIGFFRIDLEYEDQDTFDMDIRINRILNPLTVYPDPTSMSADSSDWDCCFVTEMMGEDEFKEAYPDADPISWQVDSWSDSEHLWYNRDQKQVRVAEYWVREDEEYQIHQLSDGTVLTDDQLSFVSQDELEAAGIVVLQSRKTTKKKVTQYIVSGAEVLEENEWVGKYIPIVPVYGEEVFIDGERHFYGLIHFAKDAQKMYNYWRTTTTELVALAPKAPWVGPVGAFETDMENWQRANTETIPILEYDGTVPPQRQPFAGVPAGALQEALNASDDMKSVMGLHDASLGAQSNEIAGVAIQKRIREGDTSTFHFIDNMSRAIRHAGVIILDLIPKVYSKPRILRILGEDGVPQNVAVNQPLTNEEMTLQGEAIEQREAIDRIYDLTVGKYDVTVKAGPSYTTQREEARESMIALLQAFPQAASVTGDLVVSAMDWPNADIFAKRLKALLPPGVIDEAEDPQNAAMAAQIQQMDAVIQQLMAGKEEAQAKIAVDREKIAVDVEKARVDMINAETNRLKAESDAAAKARDAELKAIELSKDEPVDDTAVTIKTMELNHDQAKTEIDTSLEQEKLAIEREKVELERQKLAAEQRQAEMDAIVRVEEASRPQVDIQAATTSVEKSGPKEVKLQRDSSGNLIGAMVIEGDGVKSINLNRDKDGNLSSAEVTND